MDLRERIVKAHVEEGQNKSEVARRFGVSRWTVNRYLTRAEAGHLAATPHPGRKPRLDEAGCEVLRRQVAEHNDWTLDQRAETLAETTGVVLKKPAVHSYLRKLGISRKKRVFTLQNETKKQERSGEKG